MRIICFGDSLSSCGGERGRYSDILQDRFPRHEFVNKGVGGETFVDARARFDADVLALAPDIVLIEFGANDWWRDERPFAAWAADLEYMVCELRKRNVRVVVLGVFGLYRNRAGQRVPKVYGIDARAVAYRDLEASIAARHGCEYVANIQEDIIQDRCGWRDRNHPNEYGNRCVADTLEPVLEKLLGEKALPARKPTLHTTRDFWNEAVALAPDRPAAVHGDWRLTFAEADALATRLACGLRNLAGCEHPKVAVFLPNSMEYFLLYWAIVKLGGAIVPLNTWLRTDSLDGIFRNVRPELLVVQSERDRDVLQAAACLPELKLIRVKAAADASGMTTFSTLLETHGAFTEQPLPEDTVSIIMHTSGTTAAPKGAVMRHVDLIFNVMATINAQDFGPSDVHLLVNPMFHCTALYSSLPAAAYQKTPVIITADTAPDSLLALIARERITTFLTVPSILQRVVALPNLKDVDTSSLRLIAYAGSPMPVGTIQKLQLHFPGVELHNFFGLTETISATHVLLGEDAEQRPASIGKLLPFVEALIVDEQFQPVPAGTTGELLFARENAIEGYYNQPGKLEEAVVTVNGRAWFRTGDLALVDEDGYFFVQGRKKDMIIVGGENVFAAEVEGVLLGLPKVREVAVKGVPATGVRESLGELIKAYIVRDDPSLTETEVRRHCHARLPSYKLPHIIEFRDALPRNPAGKVVKTELE